MKSKKYFLVTLDTTRPAKKVLLDCDDLMDIPAWVGNVPKYSELEIDRLMRTFPFLNKCSLSLPPANYVGWFKRVEIDITVQKDPPAVAEAIASLVNRTLSLPVIRMVRQDPNDLIGIRVKNFFPEPELED